MPDIFKDFVLVFESLFTSVVPPGSRARRSRFPLLHTAFPIYDLHTYDIEGINCLINSLVDIGIPVNKCLLEGTLSFDVVPRGVNPISYDRSRWRFWKWLGYYHFELDGSVVTCP